VGDTTLNAFLKYINHNRNAKVGTIFSPCSQQPANVMQESSNRSAAPC